MTKRVEKAQAPSEAGFGSLFAGIIKLAREAIIVMDDQRNIAIFNEGAERIFHYNASEVIGQPLDILLPPSASEIHSAHVRKFVGMRETSRDMNNRMEISGRRRDGSVFPAKASILKINEDGKTFFGAILHDITENREAERKVVESANFANAIFNSLSAEIAVVDAQGAIVSVNGAWQEFADRNNADEKVRKPVGVNYLEVCEKSALSGDESAKEALDGIREVLSGAKNYFTMEYPCHTTVNLRWFVMRVLPLKDRSGRVIITHQDVTPRRLSEQRLYETQRIAQIGSWELDLVTDHLYWSDEIYHIFEIDKSRFDASYEAFLDLVHPDDREKVNEAYLNSVASHKPYDTTHRLLMADRRIKFLYERGETFYALDGTPVRSVGMVQDITERSGRRRRCWSRTAPWRPPSAPLRWLILKGG
jgi:PAS domain S-box-containing protein